MIIVKLMGGLGNQMFQYAAGRCLALRHGVPLKLDLSFLDGDQSGNTPRRYALNHYEIGAMRATPWEVSQMTGRGRSILETAAAQLLGKLRGVRYYRERWYHFDPQVLNLPDNSYLEGYWQSESYFAEIAEIIRQDFAVIPLPDAKNRDLTDHISSVASVSLHIRRGDYVSNTSTNLHHGVCQPEYYNEAVALILRSVDKPHFFVFSDDPAWCVNNLQIPAPAYFVDHNGEYPHEDLRLMSLCRHHIIANSSFSWWGAWLSANPDKIVVAPQHWFNDPSINTDDLIPVGWKRI